MATNPAEIVSRGEMLEIRLLSVLPNTNDLRDWREPSWPGYQGVFAVPVCNNRALPFGLQFEMTNQFLAPVGVWDVVAVGVLFQGVPLFVAPFAQTERVYPDRPFPVKVTGLINAVV